MTTAQHKELNRCITEVRETLARIERARASGAVVAVPEPGDVPVAVDRRLGPALVAAGLLTWHWGFADPTYVTVTPKGFAFAH